MIVRLDNTVILKMLLQETMKFRGEVGVQKLTFECLKDVAAHRSTQELIKACWINLTNSRSEFAVLCPALQLFVRAGNVVASSPIACGQNLMSE